METLRETVSGSPEGERHERCYQGAATVHQQVAYGVGHGVVAHEEPLEDSQETPTVTPRVKTEVPSPTALRSGTAPP